MEKVDNKAVKKKFKKHITLYLSCMSTDILLKSDKILLYFPESLEQVFFLNTCRKNSQCYGSHLYLIRLEIRLEVTKYCPVAWFHVLTLRGIYFICPVVKTHRKFRENIGHGVSASQSFRMTLLLMSWLLWAQVYLSLSSYWASGTFFPKLLPNAVRCQVLHPVMCPPCALIPGLNVLVT